MVRQVSISIFLLLAGCSSGDPFDYVPASGSLTYEDGTLIPAEYITITFVPQTDPIGAQHPRNGHAVVDSTDGRFDVVTSHKHGDGIVAGHHKIVIEATDDGIIPKPVIPAIYTSAQTTPLDVDTATIPFEIKIPSP